MSLTNDQTPTITSISSINGLSKKRTREIDASIKKRTPQRAPALPTDIYVSMKSTEAALLSRAKKLLLEKKFSKITIHGLGAASQRAVSVALRLQAELHEQVGLKVTTSTVTLVDDVIPNDEDADLSTQTRNNSAIHVEVTMKNIAEAATETAQKNFKAKQKA